MSKKSYLLSLITLLLLPAALIGQRKDPDSLLTKYHRLRGEPGFKETDTSYINTLYSISYGIGRENLDSARSLAIKTIKLSEKGGYHEGTIKGQYALALVRLLEGRSRAAIALADQVLKGTDSIDNSGLVMRALNAKGIAFRSLQRPDSSYINYNRGLQLAKKISSTKHQYAFHLNIGLLFQNTLNFNEVLQHYKEAQRLIEPEETPLYQLNIDLKIAELFLLQKKSDSAQVYLQRARSSLNNGIGFAREKSSFWNTLGEYYLQRGEWDNAFNSFSESVAEISNSEEPNVIKAYLGLARTYYRQKRLQESMTFAHKVKKLDKGQNLAVTTDGTYKLLAQLHRSRGSLDSAQFYLSIYQRKYDSLQQSINSKSLSLLQAQYDEQERAEKLKFQEEQQASEKRYFIFFWLTVGLTALILIVIFYIGYRNYRDQARILNRITKEKDQLFTILGHDLRSPLSTLQELLHLSQEPQNDKQFLTDQLTSLKRRIFYSQETLHNMLRWVQDQLADAKPIKKEVLIEDFLPNCIDGVYDLARKKNLSISFAPEPNLIINVDPIHLEIVINNLLLNAIKFSETGDLIQIKSESLNDRQILSIRDQGIGMSSEQVNEFKLRGAVNQRKGTSGETGLGIGLSICSKLMELNGAKLELRPKTPGTEAHLTFKSS